MSKVTNGGRYRNTFDRAGSYYAASIAPVRKDPGEASVREVMLTFYDAFSNSPEKIGLKTIPDIQKGITRN